MECVRGPDAIAKQIGSCPRLMTLPIILEFSRHSAYLPADELAQKTKTHPPLQPLHRLRADDQLQLPEVFCEPRA